MLLLCLLWVSDWVFEWVPLERKAFWDSGRLVGQAVTAYIRRCDRLPRVSCFKLLLLENFVST